MNIIEAAEEFAKIEYLKNDDFHQWHHILNVLERAMLISRNFENIDDEALKLAIIFHDVDYSDYNLHPDNSVNVAVSFLVKNNYPVERIEKVKEIMLNHSTPHRKRLGEAKLLEGKIIYDADKSISMTKKDDFYNKYYPYLYLDETRAIVDEQIEDSQN